jgi:class 3 adenylate cyclase/formylglycine-generating enzyme required for sulfatase activity/dienelactone hydrolase
MPEDHRLAAIMFTDIVGYTALMGENEAKAYQLLKKNRQIQKSVIKKYKGKWLKEMGDGILASFYTITDAVFCAVAIQQICKKESDLKLRIGIHQGEIIFEDNDVFGDGVNIASRLEQHAPIGGIYVSETVYRNIQNKADITAEFVKEETFKNVKYPVKIYKFIDLKDKSNLQLTPETDKPPKNIQIKLIHIMWFGISAIIVILFISFIWYSKNNKKDWARYEIIPEIKKLVDTNFLPGTRAFILALEAEKYLHNDTILKELWPLVSLSISVNTDPPGANFYWKSYNDKDSEWILLGQTPLKQKRVPRNLLYYKIEKEGFNSIYTATSPNRFNNVILKLNTNNEIPENMIRIAGGNNNIGIVGLEHIPKRIVSDFLMDIFEVTNQDYKKFVDAGGYEEIKYWEFPFIKDNAQISWEEAMKLFNDKTDKPGPATWEVGIYSEGKENHPVNGISWYEAAAYAKFSNKQLPTVYHWNRVAHTWASYLIVSHSNFKGKGTEPVGINQGMISGVFDLAGNVREWCVNASNRQNFRLVLGGGWDDQDYAYTDAFNQDPFTRSESTGFRCIKILPNDTTYINLTSEVEFAFRDYYMETPVSDQTFEIFLRQYDYDKTDLNAQVIDHFNSNYWRAEKISFTAAYGKDKITAYLYLPKNTSPPFQTIIFFPGSGAISRKEFIPSDAYTKHFDFLLKSGRALMFPIYKGTFERGDELNSDIQDTSIFYKEHVIMWVKDFKRSMDYLETRGDIIPNNFGYYGHSWGSAMGGLIPATDYRIKTAILHVGGLMMQKTLPEVDVFNYLPRVNIPVLMLNGRNDQFYPIETSQKPMFDFLGSPKNEKELLIYPGGHFAPRTELIKETLRWMDQYLGPVDTRNTIEK